MSTEIGVKHVTDEEAAQQDVDAWEVAIAAEHERHAVAVREAHKRLREAMARRDALRAALKNLDDVRGKE